jgi:hypothetical protein
MSRFPVRRLTAAVAILAVLCLAMPAAAARPSSAQAPAVHGSSLLDQFLGWVGSWFAPTPAAKAPTSQKTFGISISLPGDSNDSTKSSEPTPTDRGGMIDPNG